MYRVLELNPQLMPFQRDIELRMELYQNTKNRLLSGGGTLKDFANGHHYFGIHHFDGKWVYREWAPNAHQLYLTGEFKRRRSLWMVTGFAGIVLCILVSLLVNYPAPAIPELIQPNTVG